MHRREFILTSGAVALTPAVAQAADPTRLPLEPASEAGPSVVTSDTHELRLAMPWSPELPGFGEPGVRLARRIERASGGRLRVSVSQCHGSGLEAVMTGAADLYYGTEHHHLTFDRAFCYFAGLPYFCGLEPHDLSAWLAVGGGQLLWDDLAAAHGVKAMLAGHTGRAPGLWSVAPVDSNADLAGRRVFALGLARDVVRAIGAVAIAMPSAELADALSHGNLDIAEWGGAYASMALGLPQATRRHIGLGLNTAGTALSLGVRRTLWERLGAADQALLEACAAEEFNTSLAEGRAHEAIVRRALVERHNVSFESMPGSVMTRVSEAADAIVADVAEDTLASQRIAASYMGFRQAVTGLAAPSLRSAAAV